MPEASFLGSPWRVPSSRRAIVRANHTSLQASKMRNTQGLLGHEGWSLVPGWDPHILIGTEASNKKVSQASRFPSVARVPHFRRVQAHREEVHSSNHDQNCRCRNPASTSCWCLNPLGFCLAYTPCSHPPTHAASGNLRWVSMCLCASLVLSRHATDNKH